MVRRLFLNDSNPEEMSKEEFKMRAAVLVKGTKHLSSTLMIGDAFFNQVASSMCRNSKSRGRSLTKETAVRVMKSSGFYDASTCAKCKHYVIPASNLGLNQLSPQRPDPTSGYDRQARLLPYCLGCQRLCMERSPDEEEKLHEFIRCAYPAHKPAHVRTRTLEEVNGLKQAFKDAGSPPPIPAIKREVDHLWYINMETVKQDTRLKKVKLQV
jgi:hypothetical protein